MRLSSALWILGWLWAGPFGTSSVWALPPCSSLNSERQEGKYKWERDSRPTAQGNFGYREFYERSGRATCQKKWSFLIYMAADNDLSPYALLDLLELEGRSQDSSLVVGSNEDVDILVQVDLAGMGGIRRYHVFESRRDFDETLQAADIPARFSIEALDSPVVSLMQERPAENPRLARSQIQESFQSFLNWGLENYPSEHVALVVWGHGQGWAPARQIPRVKAKPDPLIDWVKELSVLPIKAWTGPLFDTGPFGGIAFDDSLGTSLSIPAISRAMSQSSLRWRQGRPWDLYISDACLMQMIEVATEVSSNASFVIGSTQVQNYLGLPYREIVSEFLSGRLKGYPDRYPGADAPYWAARMIPDVFLESLNPRSRQGRQAPQAIETVTLSVLSSSEMNSKGNWGLRGQLDRLSLALVSYLEEDPLRALDLEFVLRQAPGFLGGAQDLGAFATLLENQLRSQASSPATDHLRSVVADLQAALQRSVVALALGNKYRSFEDRLALLGFRGVSAWLPQTNEEYRGRRDDFLKSRFYAEGKWSQWLDKLYNIQ